VTSGDADAAAFVVNTLGRFEVVRLGRAIDASAWGSSRTRELLVYLACHPAGVTKEQVGLALWPEASAAQVRNNFHVTLHRLRKTLGDAECVAVLDDRYALSTQLEVQFDAAVFDAEVRAGIAALKRGDPSGANTLATALGRYRGRFLDGDSVGDCAHEMSERLVRRHVEGGSAYARWLLDANRPSDAVPVLRAVIASDPLVEDVWAALMRAHARSGDAVQALKVYLQVESILLTDLEVQPGAATQELRARIQRGEVV
jgi:DNA-binding SARP family transcriptional activator